MVLPEWPKIAPLEYSVSYIPTSELSFLSEVAGFACEVSRNSAAWR
jgi:hypothetical protein